ncbi:MAG TPA: Ldh family oxidoreductase, partial [Geminicoccaceae bacterium]
MAEPRVVAAVAERRFPADTLRAQVEAILRAWGMPEDALRTTAEVMVETDLAGIDSHGVGMLATYDGMQRAGRLRLDARPRVVRETASTALVDGGAGLGHPTAVAGMRLAVDKA